MVNYDKFRNVGPRATLSAMLLLVATSASSATVTVDGNMTDLITAVGSVPFNSYTASDPMGSADSPTTESNNGFDIKNVYSYYNYSLDTLYLGISVFGTVGDSRAITDTTSLYERTTNLPNANRSVFDSNETYRFSLFNGTSISDPLLLAYGATGKDDGTDIASGVTNPNSLTVTYAVSESFDGVEFSITGLNALLEPFSPSNPHDLLIFFGAGSADVNPVSSAAEDTHLMQTQVVPIPAAAWLFGSGLMGLMGVAARKRHNNTAAV